MDNNPLVAGVVGLVTASTIYIWQSNRFTKSQKYFLIPAFIFAPLQWVGIIVILIYNDFKASKRPEILASKKLSLNINKLDYSIHNLKELKAKGIITETEYSEKLQKINEEINNQVILNSTEYLQLKSLLDSGILTKYEFDDKVSLLKDDTNTYFIIHNIHYTLDEIRLQFAQGNYFFWRHTVVTLKNGVRKNAGDIRELDFLNMYYNKS